MLFSKHILPHIKGALTLLEAQIFYAQNKQSLDDSSAHNLAQVEKSCSFLKTVVDRVEKSIDAAASSTSENDHAPAEVVKDLEIFYRGLSLVRPTLFGIMEASEDGQVPYAKSASVRHDSDTHWH